VLTGFMFASCQACGQGCAVMFLLFWTDCAALLGANAALYTDTIAACHATKALAPPGYVQTRASLLALLVATWPAWPTCLHMH
jgi:hypothetical protein